MHLELTELLTCPACGPTHGLIAFVDRMEGRRIVEGRLDCPMCERRHPIRGGAVYFGASESDGTDVQAPAVRPDLPVDAAHTAAALMGPAEGPEILAVLAGAEDLADRIASLRPEATLLVIVRRPVSASVTAGERIHPVLLPETAAPGKVLPLRPGRLDGIVLSGTVAGSPGSGRLEAAAAALRPGGRLIVLVPGGAIELPEGAGLRLLAADERAWVAIRA